MLPSFATNTIGCHYARGPILVFGQGGVPQDHPVRLRRLVRTSRLALTCRHETHCGIIAPSIPQPTCPRVLCLRIIPSTSTGSWLTPTCQRGHILASSRHECHTKPAEERLPGLALGRRDHPVRGELRSVATHAQGGAGCQTPGCREPTRCLCAAHRGQEGSSTALQSCFPCAMGRAVQAVRRLGAVCLPSSGRSTSLLTRRILSCGALLSAFS